MLASAENSAQVIELPSDAPKPVDVLAIADPPEHSRQRKLLNPQFNGKQLSSYEETIRELSKKLILELSSRETIEWMEDYAIPLPLLTMTKILGLPTQDLDRLRRWSDAGVNLVNGTAHGDDLPAMALEIIEFQAYLSEQLNSGSTGLLKKLRLMVNSDDTISYDEAISILLQLVIAGSESTSSLIGSIGLSLCTHPDWIERLIASPDLKGVFIEELIRLEPPFKGHFRVVAHETQLGDRNLKTGDRLMLDWESANRDQAVFDSPEHLNPHRAELRGHLGFGYGIHRCLGANLAKLEARIALDHFLEHFAHTQTPADYCPSYVPSIFTRRLISLPLVCNRTDPK